MSMRNNLAALPSPAPTHAIAVRPLVFISEGQHSYNVNSVLQVHSNLFSEDACRPLPKKGIKELVRIGISQS